MTLQDGTRTLQLRRCTGCDADLSNIASPFLDDISHCPSCGSEVVVEGKRQLGCMDTLDELATRLNEWRLRALRAEARVVFMDVRLIEIRDLATERWRGE